MPRTVQSKSLDGVTEFRCNANRIVFATDVLPAGAREFRAQLDIGRQFLHRPTQLSFGELCRQPR